MEAILERCFRIGVFSIFRDSPTGYINAYLTRADKLQAATRHTLQFHLIEGDSRDNLVFSYIQSMCFKRENFFPHKSDTGLPYLGSTVHPTRFACLANTINPILDKIEKDNYDFIMFLDSDLIPPSNLVDLLLTNGVDMVSPLIMAGPSFYDIWGYRHPDGRNFGPSISWIKTPELIRLQSAGGCILFKGDVLKLSRLTKEEAIVGFCKEAGYAGYQLWLDPTIVVYHPHPGAPDNYEANHRVFSAKMDIPTRYPDIPLFPFRPERSILDRALMILDKLTADDVWGDIIYSRVNSGKADLRTVLCGMAVSSMPGRYLEIGVRRGHSMAMIAGVSPKCSILGVDAWIEKYGGTDNPGPEFVRQEMSKVGHTGDLDLVSGMTQEVLTKALEGQAPFDIITVDGDHTADGTIFDVNTSIPYLSEGGHMVIDDLHDKQVESAWLSIYASWSKDFHFARIGDIGIIRRNR